MPVCAGVRLGGTLGSPKVPPQGKVLRKVPPRFPQKSSPISDFTTFQITPKMVLPRKCWVSSISLFKITFCFTVARESNHMPWYWNGVGSGGLLYDTVAVESLRNVPISDFSKPNFSMLNIHILFPGDQLWKSWNWPATFWGVRTNVPGDLRDLVWNPQISGRLP